MKLYLAHVWVFTFASVSAAGLHNPVAIARAEAPWSTPEIQIQCFPDPCPSISSTSTTSSTTLTCFGRGCIPKSSTSTTLKISTTIATTSVTTTSVVTTSATRTSATTKSTTSSTPGPCASLTGTKYRLQSTTHGLYVGLQVLGPEKYSMTLRSAFEEASAFQFRSDCTMVTGDNVYQWLGNAGGINSAIIAASSTATYLNGNRDPLMCYVANNDMLECYVGSNIVFQQASTGALSIGAQLWPGNKRAGLKLIPWTLKSTAATPCFTIAGQRFLMRGDANPRNYAYIPAGSRDGSEIEFSSGSSTGASHFVWRGDCSLVSGDNQRVAVVDDSGEVRMVTEEYRQWASLYLVQLDCRVHDNGVNLLCDSTRNRSVWHRGWGPANDGQGELQLISPAYMEELRIFRGVTPFAFKMEWVKS